MGRSFSAGGRSGVCQGAVQAGDPGMRFAARDQAPVVGTGSSRDEDPRRRSRVAGRGTGLWSLSRVGTRGKARPARWGVRPGGLEGEFLESGSGATNSGRLGALPGGSFCKGKGAGGGEPKERVTTGPAECTSVPGGVRGRNSGVRGVHPLGFKGWGCGHNRQHEKLEEVDGRAGGKSASR